MKRFRWGLALSLVAVVFMVTGCEGFKFIRRGEYERLHGIERLNADQAALITALTHDKERLTDEVNALKALLGRQAELIDRLKADADRIRSELVQKPEMPDLGKRYVVTQEPDGIGIAVGSDVLFSPGKAALKPEGEATLKGIIAVLRERSNDIRVCGFTDSQPIVHSGWKSNFELSGARALSVLNYLAEQGIAADRMHFAGYGEHDLLIEPDGTENMKKSRRVKIVLLHDWATGTSGALAPAVTPK